MEKQEKPPLNLMALAKASGVEYWTFYYWVTGRHENPRFDKNQKTQVANAIVAAMAPFLKRLGYKVTIEPVKK